MTATPFVTVALGALMVREETEAVSPLISIRVALVELTVRFPRLALFRSSVRVLTLGLLMAMSSFTVMLLSVSTVAVTVSASFCAAWINPAAVPELAEADVPPPPPPPPPPEGSSSPVSNSRASR